LNIVQGAFLLMKPLLVHMCYLNNTNLWYERLCNDSHLRLSNWIRHGEVPSRICGYWVFS